MKIELVKDEEGNPIGWEVIPETKEDDTTIAHMRDLQFFGMDETHPEYDGMTLKDNDKGKTIGNIAKLRWVQYKHTREANQ